MPCSSDMTVAMGSAVYGTPHITSKDTSLTCRHITSATCKATAAVSTLPPRPPGSAPNRTSIPALVRIQSQSLEVSSRAQTHGKRSRRQTLCRMSG